jgi:protein-tyrosine phosphatase
MIDMHNHLFPMIDDGTISIEEASNIIEYGYKKGVKHIVMTPHYSKTLGYMTSRLELEKKYDELKKKLPQYEGLKYYLSREYDYSETLLDKLKYKDKSTYLDSKYVLVDFKFVKVELIDEIIYNFICEGFIPVVAHPERYDVKNLSMYDDWKKSGALFQISATSYKRYISPKVHRNIKYLERKKFIDGLGSDIHHDSKVYRLFRKKYHLYERTQPNFNQWINPILKERS